MLSLRLHRYHPPSSPLLPSPFPPAPTPYLRVLRVRDHYDRDRDRDRDGDRDGDRDVGVLLSS